MSFIFGVNSSIQIIEIKEIADSTGYGGGEMGGGKYPLNNNAIHCGYF